MSKENTAVTSSSYTVTEGESSPWIIDSVRAMPDERLLPQTFILGAAAEIYCDGYVCVCGRCNESEKPAHEGPEASAGPREASPAPGQVRQPVGLRRGQAAGEDADG